MADMTSTTSVLTDDDDVGGAGGLASQVLGTTRVDADVTGLSVDDRQRAGARLGVERHDVLVAQRQRDLVLQPDDFRLRGTCQEATRDG